MVSSPTGWAGAPRFSRPCRSSAQLPASRPRRRGRQRSQGRGTTFRNSRSPAKHNNHQLLGTRNELWGRSTSRLGATRLAGSGGEVRVVAGWIISEAAKPLASRLREQSDSERRTRAAILLGALSCQAQRPACSAAKKRNFLIRWSSLVGGNTPSHDGHFWLFTFVASFSTNRRAICSALPG
jgi:hypothetical protein